MINRIKVNEERLDNISLVIKELEICLDKFISIEKEIKKINEYYGSKEWFDDVYNYDNNKIKKIKAGVLSEDAIWNMNEKIEEIICKMNKTINNYYERK